MLQVGARADVHVQAGDAPGRDDRPAAGSRRAASCQMPCFDCSPPVLVFWLWPWPKPGLIRSVISRPGRPLAELVDHVGRAAVDVDAVLDDQVERLRGRRCRPCRRSAAGRRLGWIAGGHRPADLAGARPRRPARRAAAPGRGSPGSSRPSGHSERRRTARRSSIRSTILAAS